MSIMAVIASEAKQSIARHSEKLDSFVSLALLSDAHHSGGRHPEARALFGEPRRV